MYGHLIFEMDGGTISNSLKDLLYVDSENGNDDDMYTGRMVK